MSSLVRLLSYVVAIVVGGFFAVSFFGESVPSPEGQSHRPTTGAHAATSIPGGGQQSQGTLAARIATVGELSTAARVKIGGYVEPRDKVRLAAQAPGRVVMIAGEAGDRVAAGQVVVALDDGGLGAEYRAAWAALAGEMSAIQNAQVQLYHALYGRQQAPMGGAPYAAYERMTTPPFNMMQAMMNQIMPGLSGSPYSAFPGAGSLLEMQSDSQRNFPAVSNARHAYEMRLTALAAAQSRIDRLDAQLRNRQAIAPYGGVITERYVDEGDVVQPGQPLVDVANVDQLNLRIDVPTALVQYIRLNEAIPISLETANIWATVVQIYPTADVSKRTVGVKLALPAEAAAAPGMYADVWLPQASGDGSVVAAAPADAVVYRGSLPVAFVVRDDNRVEMRVLRLGDITEGQIAVLSGLAPGERVVVDPGHRLQSGDYLSGSI
ncbi:MAG: efflux RND transporter periplasmic adaptor subunit [Parvularcula sp.]